MPVYVARKEPMEGPHLVETGEEGLDRPRPRIGGEGARGSQARRAGGARADARGPRLADVLRRLLGDLPPDGEVELRACTWKVRQQYQLANLNDVLGGLEQTQITNEL